MLNRIIINVYIIQYTYMITIIDVAQRAKVSPSTVSHVLNGKRPISEQTKERVRAAIKELGYEPNPNAQALRGSAAGIIGFLASDITEFFSTLIIQGVEKSTIEKNMYLLFTSGVEFNNDMQDALTFLKKRRIDGLIISYGVRKRISIKHLDKLKIPIITINTRISDEIPSVEPDDYVGGSMAAEHLLEQGSHRPAIITGPRSRLASQERVRGFIDALKKKGVSFDLETQLTTGDFTSESGNRELPLLLKKDPGIDAVFCANDYMAAGAINAALRMGIAIPEELRIIGFDNREFGNFWSIPISTFKLPLFDMGKRSADTLIDMMAGGTPSSMHQLLPCTLVHRASS